MVFVIKTSSKILQGKAAEQPEMGLEGIEAAFAFQFDFFEYFLVEVFQELLVGMIEFLGDALVEFSAQGVKSMLDFRFGAAILINLYDALFEVDPAFDGAEYFIAGAEHAVEELELLFEQFIDADIGGISLVEEIDDYYIEALSVPVASADALFDALRVPGHIIIDDHGAELEVDAFGGGFSSDEDLGGVAEVFRQGSADIGGAAAGDAVASFVFLEPILIDAG